MKKLLLTVLSGFLLLGAAHSQGSFTLSGSAAALGGDCYQITPNLGAQHGSIWQSQSIDLNYPFDLNFLVNLGNSDAGADGIAFVLQPQPTALGVSGGGLGAQGISPSVVVELDTYANGQYSDPYYDHLAITSNGIMNHFGANSLAAPVQASLTNVNIEDGQDHEFRITWDPGTQVWEVYFDCDLRLTYTGDIINQIFGGNPIVYWGYTGSTGGATNLQTVCVQSIANAASYESMELCLGDSVQIEASLIDGTATYSWTPSTSLSDPSIADPIIYPTTNTTYIGTTTTPCLQRFDTIEVNVITQYDASFSLEDSVCIYSPAEIASAVNQLGVYSGPGITPNGSFDASSAGVGVHTISYDILGNCANSSTAQITVIDTPDASFSFPAEICVSDTVTLQPTVSGGVWGGSGINPQSGFYNPSQLGLGTYQVTYKVTDFCYNIDTAVIRNVQAFQPIAPAAQSMCDGDTLPLLATINPNTNYSSNPPMYTWAGNGIITISNPGSYVAGTGAGVYTVTVTASLADGSCGSSDSVDITVFPAADTDFPLDPAYCATQSTNSPIIPNTPGIGTWTVTPVAPTTGTFSPNQFIPASIGVGTWEITYTISDAQSSNGCGNSSTDTVIIVEAPQAPTLSDSVYCVGDSVSMLALGDGVSQIEWYSADTLNTIGAYFTNGIATLADANTSIVLDVLQNNQGCKGEATEVELFIAPNPEAYFEAPNDTFVSPFNVQFYNGSQGADAYTWYFPDGSTSNEFEPEHVYNQINEFTQTSLVVENQFGCLDTFVLGFYLESHGVLFNVPNVFTPNGDGCNDLFGVASSNCATFPGAPFITNYKEYTVTVFNRWGAKIIEFGPGEYWDGENQPDGVYYYVIEAVGSDLNTASISGSIQMISRN